MITKGFKRMLAEANAEIGAVSPVAAIEALSSGEAVFVDVRESAEQATGTIPGAVAAPRGFLEFIADPEGPMHRPELVAGRPLIIYCASGGRSALAAKTLRDMGIANVSNLVGGIGAWKQAGGPIEGA